MTFPYPDPVIYLAQLAKTCLTEAITAVGALVNDVTIWKPPAEVCFRVSTQIPFDMDKYSDLCCRGLGYVALAGTWASANSFPEQDINRQAATRCAPPAWAEEYRMGLVRCLPVVTQGEGFQEGGMPTCDEWNQAAIQNMWDSVVLRKATCCFRASVLTDSTGFFDGMSVVMDRQVQGPPLGGCVERYVNVQVQHPNCDC
jgi:hypothetical protein